MGEERVEALVSIDGGGAHSHVALALGGEVVGHRSSAQAFSSEALLELVDSLLTEHRTSGIDRVAVALGPGSFTGIRSAIATAQGLVLAQGAIFFGVPTLLARVGKRNGVFRPYLTLNEGEVGVACYEIEVDQVREIEALKVSPREGIEGLCVDEAELCDNPAVLLARAALELHFDFSRVRPIYPGAVRAETIAERAAKGVKKAR